MIAVSLSVDVLRSLAALARHPDSCPQSVPGASPRAYPCTCALGEALALLENPSRPARPTVEELQTRARKARPIANDGSDPEEVREARRVIRESARGILEHFQPILASPATKAVDRQTAGLLVRLAEKDLKQYAEE